MLALVATLAALLALAWVGQSAYENVTGDAVSFEQAWNATILVWITGMLFNWRKG